MPYLPRRDTSDLVYETIENETVLVDLSNGIYFSVAGVGSEVWIDLQAGRTVPEILARLNQEYDARPDEIETAVQAFLDSLVAEGLLVYKPGADKVSPVSTAPPVNAPAPAAKRPFQAPQLQKYADMQELLLLDAIHDSDDLGIAPSSNLTPR